MKLNYEQFKKEAAAKIKDYLPESYRDYKVEVSTVYKSGSQYDALLVKPAPGVSKISCSPALNLTEAYAHYQDGASFENVMEQLAHVRTTAIPPMERGIRPADLLNFSKVKDMILPRLVNTEMSEGYLADKPHKDVADLSVMYMVVLSQDKDGLKFAAVCNALVEEWGVDAKTLHNTAIRNLKAIEPHLQDVGSAFFGEKNSINIEELEADDYPVPFFILSNKLDCAGSSMMLNPDVMDKLVERLGEIYIIPSSVNEVIIVPQDKAGCVKDLAQMCRDMNANVVGPTDTLSDRIYEYDPESHLLSIAEGIEEELDIDDDPDI